MMRFLPIALLAGCASMQTPQTTLTSGVKQEIVKVPVLQPCIFEDEIPPLPGTWMTEQQSPAQRRAGKIADGKEAEDYILRADSLLRGCAKPRPTTEVK